MRFIIEHLDKKVYPWSLLEYKSIAKILPNKVTFTNVPSEDVAKLEGLGTIETRSIKELSLKNICILDPLAEKTLSPDDDFTYYIFGGVLGNHPMDGRTDKEISHYFPSAAKRNLGDKQMSTDTAVLVTKMIIVDKKHFSDIDFIDEPEIEVEEGFSDILPYRYVKKDGKPVFPEGLITYLKEEEKYIQKEEKDLYTG